MVWNPRSEAKERRNTGFIQVAGGSRVLEQMAVRVCKMLREGMLNGENCFKTFQDINNEWNTHWDILGPVRALQDAFLCDQDNPLQLRVANVKTVVVTRPLLFQIGSGGPAV